MGLRGTAPPVIRFRLVAQYVADFLPRSGVPDGKRVVLSALRRKHQKWTNITHLASRLRIAVDPDPIPAVGRPRAITGTQRISFPGGVTAMASPPCCSGSNRASRWASVRCRPPVGVTSNPESWVQISTVWPTSNPAFLASDEGILAARLLPHFCTFSVAVFALVFRSCQDSVSTRIDGSFRWQPSNLGQTLRVPPEPLASRSPPTPENLPNQINNLPPTRRDPATNPCYLLNRGSTK